MFSTDEPPTVQQVQTAPIDILGAVRILQEFARHVPINFWLAVGGKFITIIILFFLWKIFFSNDDDGEMSAEEEVSTDEDMSETFSPDITSDEDLSPM